MKCSPHCPISGFAASRTSSPTICWMRIPLRSSAAAERESVAGRAFVVRRLRPLPIEAIARGYMAGSGWKEYQRTGAICGIALPAGLQEAEQLPQAIFTPSTKAPAGTHDENIGFGEAEKLLGERRYAQQVRDKAIELYSEAAPLCALARHHHRRHQVRVRHGRDGQLYLIDEALTPDSSRFWPVPLSRRQQPAELRQAVCARLARGAALGQEAARTCAA